MPGCRFGISLCHGRGIYRSHSRSTRSLMVFKGINFLAACSVLLVFGVQARAQAPNSAQAPNQVTGRIDTAQKPKDKQEGASYKEVSAILTKYCGDCHGVKGKPKADVDVSTYDKLMKSPSGIGKAIVAKDLKKSGLHAAIAAGEMPPEGKPKPTDKEIAVLRDWILAGAKPRRRFSACRRLADR